MSSMFPDGQLDAIGCLPTILPFVLLSATANEDQAVGHKVELSESDKDELTFWHMTD